MIQIGIAGHRFLGKHTIDFVNHECLLVLKKVRDTYGDVVALSAIAEGSDSIFAMAASSLNIGYTIVRPFAKYITDFQTPLLRNQYLKLKRTAIEEIRLPHKSRSEKAYVDAMQWIVMNSDLLVAVWDGKEGNGKGGTADTVKQVLMLKKDWVHINTGKQTTQFYSNKIRL